MKWNKKARIGALVLILLTLLSLGSYFVVFAENGSSENIPSENIALLNESFINSTPEANNTPYSDISILPIINDSIVNNSEDNSEENIIAPITIPEPQVLPETLPSINISTFNLK